MLETRLLCLGYNGGNLLERTENNHTRCAFLTLSWLLAEKARSKREEIRDRETVIRIKCRFVGKIAFTFCPIPLVIPGGVTGVHFTSQLIWQVTYD